MYNSQYYTCEQIDERLLQGYLDDYNTQTGQSLTKAQFLTKLGNIFSKEGVIDNTATQIGYYECDTAAGTAAKVITVANYALFVGGSIKVKFANKNTANNATLNINSQGAKALYYQGERASATNSWDAEEVVEIYYDGTSYYANNVKGGSGSGVYDVSKEHPTSGPNGDGKFTLEYILNSSNVNELIPVNKREPGMTIQFVSTSDNKYVQYRLMTDSWSIDTNDWSFCGDNVLVENPEWIYVLLDAEKRILAGLKSDGSVEWSIGIPTPVKTYIDNAINAIDEIKNGTEGTDIDGLNKIIAFLSEFSTSDTLKELLDTKVDKEEGKSLIDNEYAESVHFIENPEFAEVKLDSENKIIWAIKTDGSIYYGAGVPQQVIDFVNNKIAELSLDEYEDIVSFLSNYLGSDTTLKNLLDDINKRIPELEENNEFLQAVTDSNHCVVFGIKKDGSIDWAKGVPQPIKDFVNEHISKSDIQKLQELVATYTFVEDSEGRLELKILESDIIISYRKADGTLVELAGIETPFVKTGKVISTNTESDNNVTKNLTISGNINLSENAKQDIVNALPEDIGSYKTPNLPKYGTTNLRTETFYLTAYEGVESIEDVVCIQDFEDTVANAQKRMTICHYYVKNTLTDNGDGTYSINENSVRLQHYAAGKVKLNTTDNKYYAKDPVRKVNGNCYYADTLGYTGTMGSNRNVVIEGYTREAPADSELAEGAVKQTEVEVVQITGPVCVNAWTVEDWDFNAYLGADIGKKYEHNCIGDVDFGHYLSGTDMAIGVKHQGNSTQVYRKRNFRYTFYKNATFAKKDKKKIGEMIRLSKFNLKANWLDDSRLKEMILYRVFTEIWQNHRPITDRYNWDGGANGYYHGATGNIKGFPIKFSVAGDFYGIYMFTIPKDGSNYLIDDKDEDTGLFVSGAHNTNNDWGVTLPYVIADHYDSEMDSDLEDYPDIIKALERWTDFINNRLYVGEDGNEYGIEKCTFTGSDGNYYTYSQVTFNSSEGKWYHNDIEIVRIYVTDMYWDANRNTYHRSEVTKISGVNYVTASLTEIIDPVSGDITYEVNETSIVVTHFTIGDNIKFNKENGYKRLDVLGFIDYFICMQLFVMVDNGHNNTLIYSGAEKEKMFPFFYDLDGAMPTGSSYGYNCDVINVSLSGDTSLWRNIRDIYWDDIVNRYCELRKSVLTDSYIEKVYKELADNIPASDYTQESSKWGATIKASNFDNKLTLIRQRLEYLDINYFIV